MTIKELITELNKYPSDMQVEMVASHIENDVVTLETIKNSMADQSVKKDEGKARLTLVPRKILFDIAAVRNFALDKYKDPDNWKRVEKWRFQDAMMRHMCAYLDNPDSVDEESGLPHLWHMATNLAFLCEMENKQEDNLKGEKR